MYQPPSQNLRISQHSQAERDVWLAEDDDIFETVNSNQAVADNSEALHHYGDLPTKIVVVRFYRGNASPGEQILMRREPSNPYDSNAIRIDNVAGTQIGHIPRGMASKLVPFMDNNALHVEGELAGEIGTFDCPLQVQMYGPDPHSEEGVLLVAEVKAAKLPLNALKAAEQAEKQRQKEKNEAEKRQKEAEWKRIAEARRAAAAGGTGNGARLPPSSQDGWTNSSQAGPSAQPIMADILEASQRFNPREVEQTTDQYGMQEDALKNMPFVEKPESIKTKMLPYQLQALKWLLDQEDPQPPPVGSKTAVQLWKRSDRHSHLYTNIATTFSTQEAQFARGGILADDMGTRDGHLLDLYSLLRFVGITGGLENLEIFNRVLVRPLKKGDQSATFLLQAVMTAFTLRRRKEMKFIDLRLPKLDEFVHRIEFTKKERDRYNALAAEAQGLLTRYEKKQGRKGKGSGEAFQHLLEILLRMRQCCNHWQLCSERITSLLAQLEEQKTVELTPEDQKALQDMLQVQIQSQEDCPVCLETLHNPVITTCGHAFGQECISKVLEAQHKCPMCRAELKDESCLVSPANECGDENANDEMDLTESSSKLDMMMQILGATKNEGNKTIIFSQWTRFLDIV
ncbi:hypothetical protein LTR37_011941 [Vermiconidia calcicola]|uniref:Uncharacterized protein n=1 Tax=Vermiconidia calcicola TaxID=1690605 RepID=A0ACC3N0P7_9PEZI|nr:hypothetical protein LTR37_011941 [Vermiconidia calcicola]